MSADGRMRSSLFLAIVELVNNEIVPVSDDSRTGGRLYGGTFIWLLASFSVGWLPLLWINGWTPRSFWSTLLVVALSSFLGLVTVAWWFLIGWCFAVTARMRRNAVLLAALVGGVGVLIETGIQLSGPYGATGGEDPGIGDLIAALFIPVLIAVPLLLVMGAGFYIHALRESRSSL
jgi:hypothetical protein